MPGLNSGDNSDDGILTDGGYSTNDSNNPYRFDHLHESQSSVEEGESANSDDRILTDDGYSTNDSNNPYRFDHLHESQISVEEGESAEDLENKAVTDAGMINKEQNVPNLPGGGITNKNLQYYEIWIIEATDDLDEAGVRHKNKFYELLKEWFQGRDYTCILLMKRKYNEILQFCLNLKSGALPRSLYIAGNKQAYKWAAKYDAVLLEDESAVLVLRPTKGQHVDAQSICLSGFQSIRLSALQQPTYVKQLLSDLHKLHPVDHCEGNTFYKRAKQAHENVPREVCKMFTDCCPQCIRENH